MDLVGVTRDGRLAVMELKASEDVHLVMQAIDYWLRIRHHQEQQDFLALRIFSRGHARFAAAAALSGGAVAAISSRGRCPGALSEPELSKSAAWV